MLQAFQEELDATVERKSRNERRFEGSIAHFVGVLSLMVLDLSLINAMVEFGILEVLLENASTNVMGVMALAVILDEVDMVDDGEESFASTGHFRPGEVRADCIETMRKMGVMSAAEMERHPTVSASIATGLHFLATLSFTMKQRIIAGELVPVLFHGMESSSGAMSKTRFQSSLAMQAMLDADGLDWSAHPGQWQELQDRVASSVPTEAQGLDLPAGWSVATSATSGDRYFFHEASGKTQWHPPSDGEQQRQDLTVAAEPRSEGEGDRVGAGVGALDVTELHDDKGLPDGWEAMKSQTEGDIYYRNLLTGETTWEFPSTVAESRQPEQEDLDNAEEHEEVHDDWLKEMGAHPNQPKARGTPARPIAGDGLTGLHAEHAEEESSSAEEEDDAAAQMAEQEMLRARRALQGSQETQSDSSNLVAGEPRRARREIGLERNTMQTPSSSLEPEPEPGPEPEPAPEPEPGNTESAKWREAAMVDKELVRARKKFNQLDGDGNGCLAGDELAELARWVFDSFHPDGQALTEAQQEAEVEKLLRRLDENGDGVLQFEEFAEWFRKTCGGISRHRKNLAVQSGRQASSKVSAEYVRQQEEAQREWEEKQRRKEQQEAERQQMEQQQYLQKEEELHDRQEEVVHADDESSSAEEEDDAAAQMAEQEMLRARRALQGSQETQSDSSNLVAGEPRRARREIGLERNTMQTPSSSLEPEPEPGPEPEPAPEPEPGNTESAKWREAAMVDKELVRARKKFNQLDGDGNGCLAGDELAELARWVFDSFHPDGQALTEAQQEAEVEKLLRRLDENGDGVLQFEEFAEWFRKTCGGISRHRKNLAVQSGRQASSSEAVGRLDHSAGSASLALALRTSHHRHTSHHRPVMVSPDLKGLNLRQALMASGSTDAAAAGSGRQLHQLRSSSGAGVPSPDDFEEVSTSTTRHGAS